MADTIADILRDDNPPRQAVSLVDAPLSTTPAEFYDVLIDRWRSGERSPALAGAIKRGVNTFSWVQVLFVDDTPMSTSDWGGNRLYRVNGPDLKSCKIHGCVFPMGKACPECNGGKQG